MPENSHSITAHDSSCENSEAAKGKVNVTISKSRLFDRLSVSGNGLFQMVILQGEDQGQTRCIKTVANRRKARLPLVGVWTIRPKPFPAGRHLELWTATKLNRPLIV